MKISYYFNSNGRFDIFWENENGQIYREDGPAIEYSSGTRQWFKNGVLHREDGPAIVLKDGRHEYYLNGIQYFKEDYWKEIERLKKKERINDCES